mgnify:CR=1 FL=1|tara:strand:- start:284 stop:544 length:261 start_codon:yes stop_codon:yes gene_type:complete
MEIYQIMYGFRGNHYNEYFMTFEEAKNTKKEIESKYNDLIGFVALSIIEDVPKTKKGIVTLLNNSTLRRVDFLYDLEKYSKSKGVA